MFHPNSQLISTLQWPMLWSNYILSFPGILCQEDKRVKGSFHPSLAAVTVEQRGLHPNPIYRSFTLTLRTMNQLLNMCSLHQHPLQWIDFCGFHGHKIKIKRMHNRALENPTVMIMWLCGNWIKGGGVFTVLYILLWSFIWWLSTSLHRP